MPGEDMRKNPGPGIGKILSGKPQLTPERELPEHGKNSFWGGKNGYL